MKLAWICYSSDDDSIWGVTIVFEKPDRYASYSKVVPIVYAEIEV